jgi:hypothetical protein
MIKNDLNILIKINNCDFFVKYKNNFQFIYVFI